jgi:type I restriction enzyme, S subunit
LTFSNQLKIYPAYRDSGVLWMGNVPEHWEVLPLRRLLADRKEKNNPIKTRNILSLSIEAGVIPYADKKPGGNKAKEDLSAYMLAYPGDIVLNSMNVIVGSVGLSKYFGAVSPVYYMLYPRDTRDLVEFFDAVFQNTSFQRSLFGLGNGILIIQSKSSGKFNTIRMRIPMAKLKLVQLPHPGHEEQLAIIRYLDYMDRRIKRYISVKKRLVGLLNEQKQAIIQRAITRGIDPSVTLKPSHVPWIGDIPEHWELRRLRQIVSIRPSKSESASFHRENALVTFLPMDKVGVDGRIDDSQRVPAISVWSGFTYFRRGDVLVAKITPCFENGKGACLDSLSTEIGFGSTEFHVLRPTANIFGYYLRLITSGQQFLNNGAIEMTGSAGQQRVPTDFIKNYLVPLPPLDEQEQIFKNVTEEIRGLSEINQRTMREITLLREYHTRLFTDVVTGKFDVREATIKIPAMTEEPDTLKADALEDEDLEVISEQETNHE